MSNCSASETFIDVRRILPRMHRHPLIFAAFEGLKQSEALVLVNDHDPWPLLYQFHIRHPGAFVWHYEEEGPDVWRFRVTRAA